MPTAMGQGRRPPSFFLREINDAPKNAGVAHSGRRPLSAKFVSAVRAVRRRAPASAVCLVRRERRWAGRIPSKPALELGGKELIAFNISASEATSGTCVSSGGGMFRRSVGDSGCFSCIFLITSSVGGAKESSEVRARNAPRMSPSLILRPRDVTALPSRPPGDGH